jgi:hypothetical protein
MDDASPDSDLLRQSRRAWGALETVHVVGYFAEETTAEYVALGLHDRLAYFPSRAAAMGAVGPRLTEATFYVFAPWLHDAALPAAWDTVSPERMVQARRDGMAKALERIMGAPDVAEPLALARRLCDGLTSPGRPLYAAHAQLEWPADDLVALWHAATLVREHRGDGHVAVLTSHGVDPVEATLLDGAWSGKEKFLKATRAGATRSSPRVPTGSATVAGSTRTAGSPPTARWPVTGWRQRPTQPRSRPGRRSGSRTPPAWPSWWLPCAARCSTRECSPGAWPRRRSPDPPRLRTHRGRYWKHVVLTTDPVAGAPHDH